MVGDCLQRVKGPTNEVKKNAIAVVFTKSHCKEQLRKHVLQKSP